MYATIPQKLPGFSAYSKYENQPGVSIPEQSWRPYFVNRSKRRHGSVTRSPVPLKGPVLHQIQLIDALIFIILMLNKFPEILLHAGPSCAHIARWAS